MYKRVLLALDLEGVNNVAGDPYIGLTRDTEGWRVAKEQAVLEVNAAAKALFDAGALKVGLWDNHGGGNNIDPTALDPRITLIPYEIGLEKRMSFADGEYDCICFFGYHAMEGTLGGVLAHTINSKIVQYYKLNGQYIGEVDMDAYIADRVGDFTRKAVLVIPGGGYNNVCSDREGEPIAMAFLPHGYNAFVLHYTVGRKKPFPGWETALLAI